MKKKILFGIAALMIAAAATFHVQNVAFGEKESYASLESIGVMAEANCENYPHWGSYGRDTWDCAVTITASSDGTICYKGFCVDVEAGATVHIECEKCAWDCNTDGANTTCDPESC